MLLKSLFLNRKMSKPENTHLLHKGKLHCTADLLFILFGFGCVAELVTYLLVSVESKPVKQEVNLSVILSLQSKVSVLWAITWFTQIVIFSMLQFSFNRLVQSRVGQEIIIFRIKRDQIFFQHSLASWCDYAVQSFIVCLLNCPRGSISTWPNKRGKIAHKLMGQQI